LFRTPN